MDAELIKNIQIGLIAGTVFEVVKAASIWGVGAARLALARLIPVRASSPSKTLELVLDISRVIEASSPSSFPSNRHIEQIFPVIQRLIAQYLHDDAVPTSEKIRLSLTADLFRTVSTALNAFDQTHPAARLRRLEYLKRKEPFARRVVADKAFRLAEKMEVDNVVANGELPPGDVAALSDRGNPVRIAIPTAYVTEQVLFSYLRRKLELSLEIDNSDWHATGLLERLSRTEVHDRPDAMVLSDAPATKVISRPRRWRYAPSFILSPLPLVLLRQRATRSHKAGDLAKGAIALFEGGPSIPEFFIEELLARGLISTRTKRISIDSNEGTKIFEAKDPTVRVVTWAPQSELYQRTHSVTVDTELRRHYFSSQLFLFAHRPFVDHEEGRLHLALVRAVQHAWLALRHCPQLIAEELGHLLIDDTFTGRIALCAGIDWRP